MKKQIVISVASLFISLAACNDKPAPKEEPGVKIEGDKGGEMKVDKDQMKIEGKKGGELKIDSNGVKIHKPANENH